VSDDFRARALVFDCYRVGIDMPTIEVRFQNLEAEAEVRVGSSGLPTVLNSIVNTVEVRAPFHRLVPIAKDDRF
jgi:hypothetical protein